ncbi:hypothetical protein Ahu01nite_076610 [Winogradskya humida]|uniref:EAL domain-containing protein n=1 Tax=Winogradskya humida TaxID=113566 RepID=A0ABQ4A138_9ACTN|nr:hypothetical protein Ahu01nite_076610 [Actinoplanes humidus]
MTTPTEWEYAVSRHPPGKVARKTVSPLSRTCAHCPYTEVSPASPGSGRSSSSGTNADQLLRRADIAMYAAKTNRSGYMLFDATQDSSDPRRLSLASDLRQGIEQGQLVLHDQPKVDAQTSALLSAEALVRWQHPEHGMIRPDDFIPLAEHTGLITPLTTFVPDQALQQCRSWLRADHEIPIAVNISTHRLLDLHFPAEVSNQLSRWQVPAQLLTLEITESAIMADPERAMHVVQQLHDLGVHLSIDDFGTGYSSMAYLKNLPVHELKIDRSFVSNMTTSQRDAVIVRSTVELGRNLVLQVIAEGVEDMATWTELDAVGCHAIQGYYVSRPCRPTPFRSGSTGGRPRHRPPPGSRPRGRRSPWEGPPVVRVAARTETVGLDHVHGRGQAGADIIRHVGVAAEGDHLAALVAPPANDLRGQRNAGVDLQRPIRGGEGAQRVPELALEGVQVERAGLGGPPPDRIVQVGEDLKGIRTGDQLSDLGQVQPQHLDRRPLPVERVRLDQAAVDGQRVQRAEHPLIVAGAEQFRDRHRVPMGFAQLDAADDAQRREQLPAPLDRGEIALLVQLGRDQDAVGAGQLAPQR